MNQNRDLIMELNEAKRLFDEGVFVRAVIVRVPMGDGYHLELFRKGGKSAETVERQRGGFRVFATIDAAVASAEAIGFRQVEVSLQ